jgi:phytoene dehydrogenase-like protein
VNDRYDVVVVGAGFGGLGAALTAAERGARVLLLEALNYPGGCASTFRKNGCRFESGATLFSGFGPGQLFESWTRRHGLHVEVDFIDPVVEFRAPDFRLAVPPDRDRWVDAISQLPHASRGAVERLVQAQVEVADPLWNLLDHPERLPPLSASAVAAHLRSLPSYLPLGRYVARPLGRFLDRWGIRPGSPLRTYLDGLCQITIQCETARAESPFALGTMDYYFRGTGHVRGGIGRLAWALVEAIKAAGGQVEFAHRVRRVVRSGEGWEVWARRRRFRAERVLMNLLPQDVAGLVPAGAESPTLSRMARRVERSWGAAMLYLLVKPPPGAGPEARHFELVADPTEPLVGGNHVFCSISGADETDRAPAGLRTMTVSTHVPMSELDEASDPGAWVAATQARMRATLRGQLPEWRVESEMTASPRTFERFTGRSRGFVGGVPREAGLEHYLSLFPRPVLRDLWLVGDSVFPGQSTLATAIGGQRTATAALR